MSSDPGDKFVLPPELFTFQITSTPPEASVSPPVPAVPDKSALARICDLLRNPDFVQRLGAANTLIQEGPEAAPAVPFLIELLSDPNDKVRATTAEILSHLAPASSTAFLPLCTALKDPSIAVQRWAVVALGELGEVAKSVVSDLLEMRAQTADLRTRALITAALKKIDPETAAHNCLTQKDHSVGEIYRFYGHTAWVQSVAFSRNGRLALSGSGQPAGLSPGDVDCSIRLWDLEAGLERLALLGHRDRVTSVAFAPDGKRAVSGSFDETVRVWDLDAGQELRCLRGHLDRVRCVAFSPDGRHVLSGGCDNTLRLWDVESGRDVHDFPRQEHWVISVTFSPDGRQALSGGLDGSVRLWDVKSGRQVGGRRSPGLFSRLFRRQPSGSQGAVTSITSVALDQAGRRGLSGSMDRIIRLWDLESGIEVAQFRGHQAGVSSVAFTADGHLALSGSMDKTLRLWEVATGRELHVLEGHSDSVTSVALSPDGLHALSGSADKTVRFWRLPE